jgi:hypothetical protein
MDLAPGSNDQDRLTPASPAIKSARLVRAADLVDFRDVMRLTAFGSEVDGSWFSSSRDGIIER